MEDKELIKNITKQCIIPIKFLDNLTMGELLDIIPCIFNDIRLDVLEKILENEPRGLFIQNEKIIVITFPVTIDFFNDFNLENCILIDGFDLLTLYDIYKKNENTINSVKALENVVYNGDLTNRGDLKLIQYKLLEYDTY